MKEETETCWYIYQAKPACSLEKEPMGFSTQLIPSNYVWISPMALSGFEGGPCEEAIIRLPKGLSYICFNLPDPKVGSPSYIFAGSPFVRKGADSIPAYISTIAAGKRRIIVQCFNLAKSLNDVADPEKLDVARYKKPYEYDFYVIKVDDQDRPIDITPIRIDPRVLFDEDELSGGPRDKQALL